MYSGAWHNLPDCRFVDWLDYRGETTIEAVANRLIEGLGIKKGDYLIGTSLGGIVACEIANLLPLEGLALVASAKTKREISSVLQVLHPLASLTPFDFIQQVAGKIPSDLTQMFQDGHPQFIRAMCHAIFEWGGLNERRIMPLRIHGRHDRLIPQPEDVQHYVEGGHLIVMTHAQECIDFIRGGWSC
jgi:pimeloyl-ACP methyl ester carboxylesterase